MFQELDLGFTQLKNRVVMGSMHSGLEHETDPNLQARYLAERARGGVAMIITGGTAPNATSTVAGPDETFCRPDQVPRHMTITQAVKQAAADCKIILQILHAGRYSKNINLVAPSAIKSPISKFTPHELTPDEIEDTIHDFVNCAQLAKQAGYDGVEVVGSTGYLINTFLLKKTNTRTDQWGGSYTNRMRFAIDVVSRIREAVGPEFILIFRASLMDMMEDGSSWDEVVALARAVESAGANIISSHFNWHEAKIPTITTRVPRAAFTPVTGRLRKLISIPVITSNRINMPDVAEKVLAKGDADLVSMGRPMLADPDFVIKASQGREDEINTCIGCNQACLDHGVRGKRVSCLVNPRACHEVELNYIPTIDVKKIAVVGAGPAGLAFASIAAQRGHNVTLFDAKGEVGGHFNLAKRIPGKEEFHETLRYFKRQLELHKVSVRLNHKVTHNQLLVGNWDHVVIATGILPRIPQIEGIEGKNVVSYTDAILGNRPIGQRVAIIGAGGIGFDVAELISHSGKSSNQDVAVYAREWGIDFDGHPRGGVCGVTPTVETSGREIYLLQRKPTAIGKGLGPSTGWTHKISLHRRGVKMINNVEYQSINAQSLNILVDGKPETLDIDTVIICAGQESENKLYTSLKGLLKNIHLIGGADISTEIDAKRAIDQAARLAAKI
jgi:2,4-dienoyl-CoA reductase (NADPH2)